MPRQQDQDRRVRRTKKRLRDALAALMREKDLGEITVRELTDLADVNRGTFYTHYRDLEDLRRQVGQELFEELSAVLAGFQAERIRAGSTPAGLQAVLTEVFDFVAENRELFVTILGYGEMEFHTQLRVLIYRMYLREWNGLYDLGDAETTNYYLEFVVSGVIGLIRTWVASGMQEPSAQMAALATQMIVQGLPQNPDHSQKSPSFEF